MSESFSNDYNRIIKENSVSSNKEALMYSSDILQSNKVKYTI